MEYRFLYVENKIFSKGLWILVWDFCINGKKILIINIDINYREKLKTKDRETKIERERERGIVLIYVGSSEHVAHVK